MGMKVTYIISNERIREDPTPIRSIKRSMELPEYATWGSKDTHTLIRNRIKRDHPGWKLKGYAREAAQAAGGTV